MPTSLDPSASAPQRKTAPAVLDEGCPPPAHAASESLDPEMLERIEERLESLKKEIVAEIATAVAAEVRKVAADLRSATPDAVTKQEACYRLSIGETKLKGMIARGMIVTCRIGDSDLIPMSEIQRLTRPVRLVQKARGGGRKKASTYDPIADFEALGRRKKR